MSLLSEFEAKAEAMAETMLDHATVTASLKKKVEAGEAAIEDAVRGVEDKLAATKGEILDKVRTMLDGLKAEMLGDFGTVSTDAVGKAKDAVAALKAELPDPAMASASVPVSTEEGDPSAQASASASDPASSTAVVDPGVTDAAKPVVVEAPSGAAVVADTGAPAEHVAPAVEAHADAVANGSTPEVAHAEAQAAAANAGASPEAEVPIAVSVATQPAPEAAPVV